MNRIPTSLATLFTLVALLGCKSDQSPSNGPTTEFANVALGEHAQVCDYPNSYVDAPNIVIGEGNVTDEGPSRTLIPVPFDWSPNCSSEGVISVSQP